MKNYLLPIGSVVKVAGHKKPLMIFGICQRTAGENGQCYDYIGVPYPEGQMDARLNILFNHEFIEEVLFRGYESQEREEFILALNIAEETARELRRRRENAEERPEEEIV